MILHFAVSRPAHLSVKALIMRKLRCIYQSRMVLAATRYVLLRITVHVTLKQIASGDVCKARESKPIFDRAP